MNYNKCTDGCLETYLFLSKEKDMSDDQIDSEILNTNCYKAIISDDYNNENNIYAVMSYAVSQGHIECVKILHTYNAMWYTNIANIAIESNQFDCFRYIIEKMVIEKNNEIKISRKALDYALQLDIFSDYINDNMQYIKIYVEKKRYA